MAILSNGLTAFIGDAMPAIVVAIVSISAITSLWFSTRPAGTFEHAGRMRQIFIVNKSWLFIRMCGLVIVLMIFFKIGPEAIWSDATGKVVLYDLAKVIVSIFVFASFLMPLLTDYGLMDLVGTLLSRIFKKLFLLPGRSCIDALASWLAAAPVGVLITSQQYDKGNYSGREAAVIATNFSVVSLPFCVIVAKFVGLSHVFVQYYLTVVAAGLVAAMVTPRLPPLSRIPDDYSAVGRQLVEDTSPPEGLWRAGISAALAKSESAPGPKQLLQTGIHNLFDIWFGLMPALIAIGTVGLVIVEYTPFFEWLSLPFIPLLELLRLPEAATAAPALLVGFAEMFLPAVLAKGIESELTRFVIACVSISQLIYMSEVGVLILKTKIPLGFWNLVQVFLLRTLISLPIAAAAAHWIVF
jgi:nucleoside recognition membrane protein YjiH